jgi:hypothetical protein
MRVLSWCCTRFKALALQRGRLLWLTPRYLQMLACEVTPSTRVDLELLMVYMIALP